MILVTQSLEALMVSYSENEVIDLISNCSYKIILDSSSSKTSKQIIEWCGKYRELRQSRSSGSKNSSTTTSYEDKNIIDPSDLMQLVRQKQAIIVSPYGFHMLQKCSYYADPFFKNLAEAVQRHNQTITEIQTLANK